LPARSDLIVKILSALSAKLGGYPETGFQEINGYLPEADFWPASSKVCAGGHNFRVARRLSAMAPDTAESTACRNMEKRFEASARIC
jgi:hypothetical protein